MPKLRTKELEHFIKERYAIYLKRQAGKPKPWTKDPILQQYRFCNIYRELDVVTQWIAKNWREPHADDPDLWFSMYVARIFNKPETLQAVGYPAPWSTTRRRSLETTIADRRAQGLTVMNSAYMVTTHKHKAPVVGFYCDILDEAWRARKQVRPKPADTVQEFYERLTSLRGLASFMGGQVIADVKYTEPLCSAPDWWTFAASGPGSRRGLNWVLGREFEKGWKEEEWHTALMDLKPVIDDFLVKHNLPPMHAQDLQNCLCETSKMVKVQQGWGRPKARYAGEGKEKGA
jgi:hypothetical protein